MRPDLDIKKDFLFKSIKQMDSECILFGNKKKKKPLLWQNKRRIFCFRLFIYNKRKYIL